VLAADVMSEAITDYLDGQRVMTREGIFTVTFADIGTNSKRHFWSRSKTPVLYLWVAEIDDILEFDLWESLTLVGNGEI
jgi:hypothetical protein